MKKILTSLITIYSLSTGQSPPITTSNAPALITTAGSTHSSTTELNIGNNIPMITPTTTTTTAPVISTINAINPSNTVSTSSIPISTASMSTTTGSIPPATSSGPTNIATSKPPATSTVPITTSTPITTIPATTTTSIPTYINPYCPAFQALERMGQQSQQNLGLPAGYSLSQNAECRSNIPGDPRSKAIDFEGMLTCNNYYCCLCQEINCGASGYGCNDLQIGDSGAVGVQNIIVQGKPGVSSFMGQFGQQNGAHVDCGGLESCKHTQIHGEYVGQFQCTGDHGCEFAKIFITDPADQMNFQCNGLMSCKNAYVEIRITINALIAELGTIEFNGQQSAQSATIKIVNEGFTPLLIQNLECMNPSACIGIQFIIEGSVMIETCDLQGIQNLHSLPPVLQSCVLGQGNAANQFFPQMPATFPHLPQQTPQYPPYTQPTYPSPVNPYQPPTVPAPQVPGQVGQTQTQPNSPSTGQTNPTTPSGQVGQTNPTIPGQVGPTYPYTPGLYGSMNSVQLNCEYGQCMNRAITLSPANNFQLQCQMPGQCNGLQLTLNVGYDSMNQGHMVDRIDSLTFSAPTSNVAITINNVMGIYGTMIEINDIRCEVFGACNNLKIITASNVEINNVDCQQPGSCVGCTINGMSCDMLSHSTGFGTPYNNYGYGYGYSQYPQYQQPVNQQPVYTPQQQSPFQQPPYTYPQWQI